MLCCLNAFPDKLRNHRHDLKTKIRCKSKSGWTCRSAAECLPSMKPSGWCPAPHPPHSRRESNTVWSRYSCLKTVFKQKLFQHMVKILRFLGVRANGCLAAPRSRSLGTGGGWCHKHGASGPQASFTSLTKGAILTQSAQKTTGPSSI